MAEEQYRYVISLFKDEGAAVGDWVVAPDFDPAREWASWVGVRKGRIPPGRGDGAEVTPLWHESQGPPFLRGFRVTVAEDGRRASADFPLSYFTPLARQVSGFAVEEGLLEAGETFRFTMSAQRLTPEAEPAESGSRFQVESSSRPLPVRPGVDLGSLLVASTPRGTMDDQNAPVLLNADLLDETAEIASKHAPNETGGVLIGHLYRDAASPEVYAVVTAQVPARHTRGDLAKLTFTAQTWTAVRSAMDIRGRDELMLGWWHSHCFAAETCKECAHRRDGTCAVSMAFMSADDLTLHRTVFPRAYHVALVVAESPCGGLEHSLFGWRGGVVAARGYHLLAGAGQASITTGASDHAER